MERKKATTIIRINTTSIEKESDFVHNDDDTNINEQPGSISMIPVVSDDNNSIAVSIASLN